MKLVDVTEDAALTPKTQVTQAHPNIKILNIVQNFLFKSSIIPYYLCSHQPLACQWMCSWLWGTPPLSVWAGQHRTGLPHTQCVRWETMACTTAPPLEAAVISLNFLVAPAMTSVWQQPALQARVYPATQTYWTQVGPQRFMSPDLNQKQQVKQASVDKYMFYACRTMLPTESDGGPGDSGDDQCLVVSRQRLHFFHHFSDIIARTRSLPHAGVPLPHGMHHLWHQLHRHHGGIQPEWAKVQLHLPGLLIQ